jgi:hypothetical protein
VHMRPSILKAGQSLATSLSNRGIFWILLNFFSYVL